MVNQETLELIKRWEGCKLKAYKCPAGVWTVGYGLTSRAGFIEVGPDTTLTAEEAEYYLEKVVADFADKIRPSITAPINENQFGAFVSLAYNVGVGAFKKSSALRRFNAGELDKVPDAMRMWRRSGGKVLKGLVNRREDEVRLFLTPVAPAEPEQPAVMGKGRQSIAQSRTAQASVVQGASAVAGAVGAISSLDGRVQLVALVCCTIVLVAALVVLRERVAAWVSGWR